MNKQKQNFKIIEFLIKNKKLQVFFKKISILMDDINIKAKKWDNEVDFMKSKADSGLHIHSPIYRHLGASIYRELE